MPWLVGLIGSALGSFVFRLLSTIGIGFTTYFIALPNLLNYMRNQINALPVDALQVLGILRFDIAITIVASAYAARGLTGMFVNKAT